VAQHAPDNSDLFKLVRAYVERFYPGRVARRISVELDDGEKIKLPVSPGTPRQAESEDEAEGQPRHSPDFRSVFARGRSFSFSPTQAAVVKQLWDALENGAAAVGQDLLLEAAGSESKRLRDLFRKADGGMHASWGLLIIPDGKGAFRLDLGL